MQEVAQQFIDFVDNSPLPYQFCEYSAKVLKEKGFTELFEENEWKEIPDNGFFIRDGRALVAWKRGGMKSAIIVGTHDDSPCLKVKPNFQTTSNYAQVAVSTYGGGIWKTFFDRDLRLAGRLYETEESGEIKVHTFDSKEGVAFIPATLEVKDETQLRPIFGADPNFSIVEFLSKLTGVPAERISNFDASFIDAYKPAQVGTEGDFIAAERIDNLASTFCGMEAFLKTEPKDTLNVLVVFDNEEVGSNTIAGAKSDLLNTFFRRIVPEDDYASFIARSLLVSSDNAHAYHPNYMEKHEQNHRPLLGGGPVVKRSPSFQYATDMSSLYPLRKAAERSKVPIQMMLNRNDIPSGSTIGPLAAVNTGLSTVDIGLPQLAMHSIRELLAVRDIVYTIDLLAELYGHYEECRLRL
jgi:aspartyl aminopeptidase